jgi:hypothetical protein
VGDNEEEKRKKSPFTSLLCHITCKKRTHQRTFILIDTIHLLLKMFVTRLENLSNEILYEIFEYLDTYFVHNIFSNFNLRFKYLLNYSSLPLKLNLAWTSKSIFEYYSQHIIIPNQTRIISLQIPNPLSIKLFLSSFSLHTAFNRLESLNFGTMNSDQIISLLTQLQSLPHLFSLSINIKKPENDINEIYQLIVTLPVLKYCKISSESDKSIFSESVLPRDKEQPGSSIEYLILNGHCRFDQLGAVLSYTPRLTHLSCHSYLNGSYQIIDPVTTIKLRKLNIELRTVPFNLFKLFIGTISSRLEVLYISAQHDKTYLDANQWQQLITCQMPHLRIFDFQFQSELCDTDIKSTEYDKLFEQFNAEFWLERKWFFTSQNRRGYYGLFKILYSICPYRYKKIFTLISS